MRVCDCFSTYEPGWSCVYDGLLYLSFRQLDSFTFPDGVAILLGDLGSKFPARHEL